MSKLRFCNFWMRKHLQNKACHSRTQSHQTKFLPITHVRHISGRFRTYSVISLTYPKNISCIFKANLRQISGKSVAYLRNYLRNITDISQANLRCISRGIRHKSGISSIYQAYIKYHISKHIKYEFLRIYVRPSYLFL